MITCADLIKLGFKPSKLLRIVINYANTNSLSIDDLREYMNKMQPVYLESLEYHKKIRVVFKLKRFL